MNILPSQILLRKVPYYEEFLNTNISVLFANTLLAQSDILFSNDSDTTLWYQYKNDYARQFKLGLIEKDTTDGFGLLI